MSKKMIRLKSLAAISFLSLSLCLPSLKAQNVGIGTNSPDASAKLDISDANRGLLIPRVDLVNASIAGPIASPATGLLVYNTRINTANADVPSGQTAGFYYWNGSRWVRLGLNNDGWKITGNAGTNPSNNFLGTTDNQNFIIRTNNVERIRTRSTGEVAVNNNNPFTGDRFTVNAAGSDYAINGYSTGTASSFFAYHDNLGDNALILTDAPTSTRPALTTYHTGSGPTILAIPEGTGAGMVVNFPLSNTIGTGLVVNAAQTAGGPLRRGISVTMNPVNTEAAYLGFQQGPGRVANFQQSHPSTNQPAIFSSVASPQARVINVQNAATTSTATAIFANQASTGLNTTTFTNAAAIWGQSSGLYGGVFLASGPSNSTTALTGIFNAAGDFDAIGVIGGSTPNTGWGIGVVGVGGYFGLQSVGDFTASGTKAFSIDHPLDPENKVLRHFAIESPEVLNMYRGNITLDQNGEALVELPNYFGAINTNFSYNLTPIGGFAQLYIAEEIDQQGRFKIAGGQPNMKVSWYVHAERNDVYLQQNPQSKQVEANKRGPEVGRYYYPEGFGQPAEKRIYHEHTNRQAQTSNTPLLEDRTSEYNGLDLSPQAREKMRQAKAQMQEATINR